MPSTATQQDTQSTTNGQDKRVTALLKQHRELVALYPVKTGAAKATVSTKIGNVEYELELLDEQGVAAEYEPWEKPTAYKSSWELSEDQLVERIAHARAIKDNPAKRDLMRARAESDLAKLLDQATKRGVSVPA